MRAVRESNFAGIPVEIFADSGAFSAFTLGKKLDPGAYIEWAERFEDTIDVFAGPDVIGDPDATAYWTRVMRGRIRTKPVLPTFHIGEDWRYLHEYVEEYDYIALGGLVPFAAETATLSRWLRGAFSRIPSSVRTHGFGMTSLGVLMDYPWYSVDSTTWSMVWRYASLRLFDPARPRQMREVDRRSSKELLLSSTLLRSYDVNARDMHISLGRHPKVLFTAVESWRRAEAWISKRRTSHADSLRINFVMVKDDPTELSEAVRLCTPKGG